MTTTAIATGQSTTRRTVLTVTVVVVVLIAGMAALSHNVREKPSPTHTLDRYTTAVQSGDGRALEQLVSEDSQQRETLLQNHAGHPTSISAVTMQATASSAWWNVTITYDQALSPMPTEHLMIQPRPGQGPDATPEWVVS